MLRKISWFLCFIVMCISIIPTLAIDEVVDDLGKIAIIGSDYNVYTYNFTEETATQLTTDATITNRYQWTTWSTDGRLAFFCCENNALGQAYISSDGEAQPQLAYENAGTFILYAYWSPADCGTDCRELAMLVNSAEGLSVDVLVDDDTSTSSVIATGAPFYYHWDSTGTQMIFHRSNSQLDIYNRAQDDISQTLQSSSGQFQAPVWSPIDDRILVGLQGSERGLTNLATINADDVTVLVEDLSGFLSFLWSPDGQYIAYRTIDQFGSSGVNVIDANTGQTVTIADSAGVLGFFWSPDSRKIAYLSIDLDESSSASAASEQRINQSFVQNDSPTRITWQVLDIEAQTNISYSSFIPTFEFLYLVTYFDQFSPSHRVWSPDSRYLVFAGGIENGQTQPEIYTVDTENPDATFNRIAEGVFGVWSFE